jgi:hypothetical protein
MGLFVWEIYGLRGGIRFLADVRGKHGGYEEGLDFEVFETQEGYFGWDRWEMRL